MWECPYYYKCNQSIKDFAALYKSKNQLEVNGASKKGSDPRKITVMAFILCLYYINCVLDYIRWYAV